MSEVNLDALMNQTTEGEMPTSLPPCPQGEFLAQIEKVEPRSGVSQKTGNPYVQLVVTWNILDEQAQQAAGRETLRVRQSMLLDLDDSGNIISGKPDKNIGLGQLRDALGQNDGGPWSPSMLQGTAPVIVRVGHRPDPNDPGRVYDEVVRVAKAA